MKPILFNTEMVKAILDGRKTTTRRVIKPHYRDDESGFQVITRRNGEFVRVEKVDENECGIFADGTERYVNPPYSPSDILYVRETFAVGRIDYGEEPDGTAVPFVSQCIGENDIIPKEYAIRHDIGVEGVVWKPSIFMPREAARIFLRVTDVHAERLQDITQDGAKAEGVPEDWPMDPVYCPTCKGEGLIGTFHPVSLGFMEVECPKCEKATKRFENLWNSTIKKADLTKYGWSANPWVWVIKFERCEKPEEEQ